MFFDYTTPINILGSLPTNFITLTANPVVFLIPLKLQFPFFLDTLILFCGAFILLLLKKHFSSFHSGLPFMAAVWLLISSIYINADSMSSLYSLTQNTGLKNFTLLWDSFLINKTVVKMKVFFFLGNIFVLAFLYTSFRQASARSDLYYFIPLLTILLSCIGSLLLMASNLLTLLLCIETFSFLGLYIIRLTSNKLSAEASLLYFFMSMLSTGFLSLGFLLVYLGTGSVNLADIADYLFSFYNPSEQIRMSSSLTFGFGFIFGTFLFKLAAFPCFFWLPLTFKAMSFAGVVLTSFTIKFVNVCLFVNLCSLTLPPYLTTTSNAIWILCCAVGSIFIGTFLALQEFNFRKFLAFTSVNQMGYILLGLLPLTTNTIAGFDSLTYFITIYFISSLLFLSAIAPLRINNLQIQTLSDFRTLFTTSPWAAWMCLLAIFTMAGLPPTAGFWAKYYIIRNCWDTSLVLAESNDFIRGFQIVLWAIVFLNFFSAIYYIKLVIMLMFNTLNLNWVNYLQHRSSHFSLVEQLAQECKNFKMPKLRLGLKYALETGYSDVASLLEEGEHTWLNFEVFVKLCQLVCASYILLDFIARLN